MVLQQSNAAQPGTMTGAAFMGVENQKVAVGKDAVEVEQVEYVVRPTA